MHKGGLVGEEASAAREEALATVEAAAGSKAAPAGGGGAGGTGGIGGGRTSQEGPALDGKKQPGPHTMRQAPALPV